MYCIRLMVLTRPRERALHVDTRARHWCKPCLPAGRECIPGSRQPAIIFFDEIDGLAPVRSSKTDQIHNSIVATLLALMDGLDSRGRVVVLGATNRVDAIDGALRRPGRFDRELAFPLPNATARAEILRIHTRAWEKPPSAPLLEQLATRCVGYCGADLKALCTEAAVHALRRRYPQIYESDEKLLIDPGQVVPGRVDFRAAMEAITPASHRAAQAHARPLGPLRSPLMGPSLEVAVEAVRLAFPPAAMAANASGDSGASGTGQAGALAGVPPGLTFELDDLEEDGTEDEDASLELLEELDGGNKEGRGTLSSSTSSSAAAAAAAVAALEFINYPMARQPRLLLAGPPGSGQAPLGAALLHELESFPVHAVGLPSLLADGGGSGSRVRPRFDATSSSQLNGKQSTTHDSCCCRHATSDVSPSATPKWSHLQSMI